MRNQGQQWAWRAVTRRLLIAPVVAGLAGSPALAQSSGGAKAAPGSSKPSDPKDLLKAGREALKAGNLDQAQDLAKQADANNATGSWGLFADTPESLEKDIAAARAKASKVEAQRLVKSAREMSAKPARTPGERIANLDAAYAMADKAMTLAGPGDFLGDMFSAGERPDKVKKEIDAARVTLRNANPGVVSAAAAAPKDAPSFGGVKQAGAAVPMPGKTPAPSVGVSDADRKKASALVASAREMIRAGKFAEAKALATQAQAMNVPVATPADLPEGVVREAVAGGKAKVDLLLKQADAAAVAKDFAKADSQLSEAKALAQGLGLSTKSMDDQMVAVRKLAESAPAVAVAAPGLPALPAVPAMPSLPGAVAIDIPSAPAGAPVMPSIPVAPSIPSAPSVPAVAATEPVAPALPGIMVPAPGSLSANVKPAPMPVVVPKALSLGGEQLLAQAKSSLQSGDLEMAKKLCYQAINSDPASKDEASALLREINAEAFTRTKTEASATLKNASIAYQGKHYEQCLATLKFIDPATLTVEQRMQLDTMAENCQREMAKIKPASAGVAAAQIPPELPAVPGAPPVVAAPPAPTAADQVRSAAQIEFGKLRSDGLEAMDKASAAFQKGDADVAVQMLADYVARVKASSLDAGRQAQLTTRPEQRLATYRNMAHQVTFLKGEQKQKQENREKTLGTELAKQQKYDEIKKKTAEVNDLVKQKKFRDAESLALVCKNMDPEDPTLNTLYEVCKRQRRLDEVTRNKSEREQQYYGLLTDADKVGPDVSGEHPLVVDPARALNARRRGEGSELYVRPLTETEREIEVKLERLISVDFKDKTLRDVLDNLKGQSGLNITVDSASLSDASINLDAVKIDESLRDLSIRDVMTILLDKARLKFVIENNVVRVTTEKKAQGKLITKVFSVMELVTPVPDFALAPHQSMAAAMKKAAGGTPSWQDNGGGRSTYNSGGMGGSAELVSGRIPGVPGGVQGNLDNQSNNNASPLADSATLATSGRVNHSDKLKKLITAMVKPYSWQEAGGSGKVEYFDLGGALVVNQTADVIGEVQQLLESLRRLQEVSVSVEIRVVSLSESFFERIGVDFAANIKTTNRGNFEKQLTTGQFASEPFINSISANNVTVGYNPTAGGFTSDLNVPIRTNSYGLGVPPFGGYPGPGNGGLGVGLAFLNDIQVFLFMEAAAGDRRVNIMQAPKITLFNGQTSTVFVSDFAFFTTGLDVINVGGQFVYIPRNTPIPIGNSPAPPGVQSGAAIPGVTVTVQAIVSSDRRFVRLNLAPTLTSLTSATVPLFPVTAFITPVFEGGSQGVPIPFTQFFQQPSISEINVQTTVQVPDGGTVVLGGLKTLAEGRNEFGPPVLSQIPYVNRLFRNQGIGRETRHIMLMVTPRIIIQSEEELNQTGGGTGGTGIGQ